MMYLQTDNAVKNVIVLGANGMLGFVVAEYLEKYFNVTRITSKEFDILKDPIENLNNLIAIDTSAIINCAGAIKPRVDKMSPVDAIKINSLFPIRLSKQINDDIDVIHISTDCVFTGRKGSSYTEDDTQDAEDLYGITKALGETCEENGLVIRTSIIGEEINNKYSLLEWAISQKGKEVNGWTDHIWSGVTTLQLAKFIHYLLTDGDPICIGLTHYASSKINKYELLKLINSVYDLNLKINAVESGKPCDRSLVRLYGDYPTPPSLEQQLIELKEFFENVRR